MSDNQKPPATLAEMLRQADERRRAFHEGFRRKMTESFSKQPKKPAADRAPGGAK